MDWLKHCSKEFGKVRNGKQKIFFLDYKRDLYATNCSCCGEIKHVSKMTKSRVKPHGVDSRCIDCERKRKERKKFECINFDEKIKSFLNSRQDVDNLYVERGVQKNGYSRVIIRNKKTRAITHLSCCDCHEIYNVNLFTKVAMRISKTGYKGHCKTCEDRSKKATKEEV